MRISNRRGFLWTIAGIGGMTASAAPKENETVYSFSTPECEGRMSVQFLDRYSSKGFWFKEHGEDRRFCLSGQGQLNRNCLSDFTGSMAIAIYHLQAHSHVPGVLKIREHVRTIDQDSGMTARPPFEATLPLQRGTASDIQAFGYTADQPAPEMPIRKNTDPWCIFRQDLYLDDQPTPFLIVHWKHTLNAISLIDVIPGDETRLSKQ